MEQYHDAMKLTSRSKGKQGKQVRYDRRSGNRQDKVKGQKKKEKESNVALAFKKKASVWLIFFTLCVHVFVGDGMVCVGWSVCVCMCVCVCVCMCVYACLCVCKCVCVYVCVCVL